MRCLGEQQIGIWSINSICCGENVVQTTVWHTNLKINNLKQTTQQLQKEEINKYIWYSHHTITACEHAHEITSMHMPGAIGAWRKSNERIWELCVLHKCARVRGCVQRVCSVTVGVILVLVYIRLWHLVFYLQPPRAGCGSRHSTRNSSSSISADGK